MTRYKAEEKHSGVIRMGPGLILHLSMDKSKQRMALLPSWVGIASDLKVLRSLAARCSNKVYVSDVNTTC